MELSEHPCVLRSFVPAHGTISLGLLRASSTGIARIFQRGRPHWEVQDWCVYMVTGRTRAACPRHQDEVGRAPPLLIPGPCKLWRHQRVVLTHALCKYGGKFRITACKTWRHIGAVPQRYRAPLFGWNWELNAVLGAATRHAELSLFKGLGLCKRTRGIAKPQTMKTTLNERLNERKKVVKMSRLMFS